VINWFLVCVTMANSHSAAQRHEEFQTEYACLIERDRHVLETWKTEGYPKKKPIDCACKSKIVIDRE
jgi:hypothetical protein